MGGNSGLGDTGSGGDDHDVSGHESTQCTVDRVTSGLLGGIERLVARSAGCPYGRFLTHSLGYVRSGTTGRCTRR